MAVYNDIIARSLRLLKVKESGENLSASEASDGLSVLNGLLDAWSNEPYMQWGLTEVSQALTTNDESYTIGSSGDINTTRPIRIDSAYIRDSNNVDTPLKLINAQEYSLITLKTFSSSYPCYLYYNQQYPLGVIKLFPNHLQV